MGKIYTPDTLNDILQEMQSKVERLEKYVAVCCFATGDFRMTTGATLDSSAWLLCDGKTYSRSDYPDLNKYLSANNYPYGSGDGSTTFQVPNFSGRVPVGPGTGTGGGSSGAAGTTPSGGSTLTARKSGDWGGAETHTLSTTEMPAHTHGPFAPGTRTTAGGGDVTGTGVPPHNSTPAAGATGWNITTPSTGGGNAHNNVQPFLVCNFYIKT